MCLSNVCCSWNSVKFMIYIRVGRGIIRAEETNAPGGLYEARLSPMWFGSSYSVGSSSVPIRR